MYAEIKILIDVDQPFDEIDGPLNRYCIYSKDDLLKPRISGEIHISSYRVAKFIQNFDLAEDFLINYLHIIEKTLRKQSIMVQEELNLKEF